MCTARASLAVSRTRASDFSGLFGFGSDFELRSECGFSDTRSTCSSPTKTFRVSRFRVTPVWREYLDLSVSDVRAGRPGVCPWFPQGVFVARGLFKSRFFSGSTIIFYICIP
ncbi:hypothetical protein Taro_052465 [Colocasia esculenta]|uniref:Uncharacterized protein n=1 Tax=Colocasia esculenta TaxID=4460 RepID=A0A843XJZ2_COLES|nr:hypothetical protein [Colocasia esculenta]